MKQRPIEIRVNQKRLGEDAEELARRFALFRHILGMCGTPELRTRAPGFDGLLRIIVGQQLSVRAAGSIWERLAAAEAITPEGLLDKSDETLQQCGLSRAKRLYARHLGQACLEGTVDFEALEGLPDEAVIQKLTALKGVGRWSAEIYLLFCLHRPDVLPAGDLALQRAFQKWHTERSSSPAGRTGQIPGQTGPVEHVGRVPTPEENLRHAAHKWHPRRAAAAFMLWSFVNLNKVIS